MAQRMSELLARQARKEFVGRVAERAALGAVLEEDGPRVIHVHGIAGIGKSALLACFAADARAAGAVVVSLDCRRIEPTESGFRHTLCEAIGGDMGVDALAQRLGALSATVVLMLDTYEVFRLMDTWLRQVFVPALSDNVRVIFFGRERPYAAWHALPGGARLLQSIALAPLDEHEAVDLLARLGTSGEDAARLARFTHGHPLALRLAAAACEERPGLALEQAPLQQALDELTRMFLADVGDPATRRILEGASVARRTTISLLRSLFPEFAPQDAYDRLQRLPFVEGANDGLVIHDAVREVIARSLRARDPGRYLDCQRTAWRQLLGETALAGGGELWRYTADMLYLIENPVVRDAFFPRGTQQLAVEPAHRHDHDGVTRIVMAHEGTDGAAVLLSWWRHLPGAFSVVRGRDGEVVGVCGKLAADEFDPGCLHDDPVTAQWRLHLARNPLAPGERAIFCRRWLSLAEGESPSDVQAAIWLDLKRTYMEMRPGLRRVYLTVRDLPTYAPVAQRLGFVVLAGQDVVLDGLTYHSAMLDFGPRSVDGWLADLAAAELGIAHVPALLDVAARELVLDDGRVGLTPLEFDLIHYLLAHPGKAISRGELLRHIWGAAYAGNSNVVDAVVCTLRRKLGEHARRLETVSGVGYRLRSG
ncbi:MAG: winged helix-turn-helix domain-containing protein [Azoarcus sp.]|nr:winged helix-turn-helix domain-containing protein [Azoarcus sp.]